MPPRKRDIEKLVRKHTKNPPEFSMVCTPNNRECSSFIGKGTGHGINGTILCSCRPGTGDYGEVTHAKAKTCEKGKSP